MIELQPHETNRGSNLAFDEDVVFENVPSLKYDVVNEGGKWFATRAGGGYIPLNDTLGSSIHTALRIRDKVDKAIDGDADTLFRRKLARMNCRKSAWVVRYPKDALRLSESVNATGDVTREDVDTMSGIPELRREVDALLVSGEKPIIGTGDNLHIEERLDTYSDEEFPIVVHIFDITMHDSDDLIMRSLEIDGEGIDTDYIMKKLHRDHTFLVLGRDEDGRYACFEKPGPRLDESFDVRDLESVLAEAVFSLYSDRIFLSVVGPGDAVERAEDSNT